MGTLKRKRRLRNLKTLKRTERRRILKRKKNLNQKKTKISLNLYNSWLNTYHGIITMQITTLTMFTPKKLLSETNKNNAMAQMLQAFVDSPSSTGPSSPAVKMGPKSAQQQRATPANRDQRGGAQKRPGGECDVVMERISKNPRAAAANSRVTFGNNVWDARIKYTLMGE